MQVLPAMIPCWRKRKNCEAFFSSFLNEWKQSFITFWLIKQAPALPAVNISFFITCSLFTSKILIYVIVACVWVTCGAGGFCDILIWARLMDVGRFNSGAGEVRPTGLWKESLARLQRSLTKCSDSCNSEGRNCTVAHVLSWDSFNKPYTYMHML